MTSALRICLAFALGKSAAAFLAPRSLAAAAAAKRQVLAPRAAEADGEAANRQAFDDVVMKTYGRYPITMVSGKGVTLTDSTGKTYLDFVAGIATCCLGHAHPGLIKAVTSQIKSLHHVSNLYYTSNQGSLAGWLVKNSPMDRAFFCNSGAEANEAAIKLARKHAYVKLGLDEPVIITAKDSFHGRTIATITATGQPKYQKNFGPLVPGFEYVPYNDPDALRKAVARINAPPSWRRRLQFWKGPPPKRGVAAILLECLQGEGGVKPGTPAFFQAARECCDATGALLVCDEVQTGMGRTGKLWGFEHTGVAPDVFTVAKALGGGVPIGAMCCTEAANVFAPGDHASTYGGNPLACAAGLAVTQAFDNDGVLANVQARGAQLEAGLKALQANPALAKLVKEVRGQGLLLGVELMLPGHGGALAGDVVGAAAAEGLLLVPAGPQVVRFVPPLVVTAAEVDQALAIFERALLKHA